ANHAELRRSRAHVRVRKRRMVERIEEFRPELERRRLASAHSDCRVLHQGQVEIIHTWTDDHSVAGIAEGAERVVGEATRVEPTLEPSRVAAEIAVASAVRAVHVLPADIGWHTRRLR